MKSIAILLLVVGGLLAVWGFTYTESHDLQSGLKEVFGKGATSDEFDFASVAGPLGAVIAVVGVGMFMAAVPKK